MKRESGKSRRSTSWDPLAAWYDGWVGEAGSKFHQKVAIPAVLDLLELQSGERVLDIGSGQGVLAPYIRNQGGDYVGVEISHRLIEMARRRHTQAGQFVHADALRLAESGKLGAASFDAAIFLLSLQDMDPLDDAVGSASWALKSGGRLILLLTHPCFRIPRQSGWGWDEGRKLQFRRIDRYLSPLAVPLKPFPGRKAGVTRSFHRPIQDYFNALSHHGLWVDRLREIPTYKVQTRGERARAINLANKEIPLFLGVRARKPA